jgi:hypothetical protein
MKIKFVIVLLSLVSVGCSTASTRMPKIEDLESLKVGKSTKKDVNRILGTPKLKLLLKGDSEVETWCYYEGAPEPISRVGFDFEPNTGLLEAFSWHVKENEAEADLVKVKSRYSYATFISSRVESRNPHIVSYDLVYEDNTLGIGLFYSYTHQKVESISWYAPKERSISSSKKSIVPWTIEKVLYDPTHYMDWPKTAAAD